MGLTQNGIKADLMLLAAVLKTGVPYLRVFEGFEENEGQYIYIYVYISLSIYIYIYIYTYKSI